VLKRDITYEDFDGEKVTETFYFNLTKTELLELQIDYPGGLEAAIRAIIKAEDIKSLVGLFKDIVLLSYGIRSEDGKRFIKSDKVREEFTQTAAYDELFMDLATNEDSAAAFIMGVVPKGMAEEIEKSKTDDVQLSLENVSLPQHKEDDDIGLSE
jgi:hypothetical protein